MKKLLKFYSDTGNERVGFILKSGRAVEVDNICNEPAYGFDVRVEDLEKYEDRMVATWHTHPGGSSNLSADDFTTYLNWPHLSHYVVGKDGVRHFKVVNGALVNV
jgi:proteasome lid subunit RPN8/RPN11